MRASDIVTKAVQNGVFLSVEKGALKFKARENALTSELKTLLQKHKAEIISFLESIGSDQPKESELPDIQKLDNRENLQLSFAQQRLWFLNQMDGNTAEYNLPRVLFLQGQIDPVALEKSIKCIVDRHEVLRTRFTSEEGHARQIVSDEVHTPLLQKKISDLSEAEQNAFVAKAIEKDASTAFDLNSDLPLRVQLINLSPQKHYLLFNMHHIVSDGWSTAILIREFSQLYDAFKHGSENPLPELEVQYADFAQWQRQWLQGERLQTHLGYWQEQLANLPQVHNLPLDKARPAKQRYRGVACKQRLPVELLENLKRFCKQHNVTLFMFLQSTFSILLSRYSGEKDIVVGSAIAGRLHKKIEPLIGFFVNNLVLRSDLSSNPDFLSYLQQSKNMILDAYAHQYVPFEMLVETLSPERNLSYNPLIQIKFDLQNNEQVELQLEGLNLSLVEQERNVARHDLYLSATEAAEGLDINWQYSSDLFNAERIEGLLASFEVLIRAALAAPHTPIHALPILPTATRDTLLHTWNNTARTYPQGRCLHEYIEDFATRQPEALALRCGEDTLSFGELDAEANRVANYLIQQGVQPDDLVGLCIERSLAMYIGLLGIMKAGAAYVPLDPSYPQERLDYMLEDSAVKLVVTESHLLSLLDLSDIHVLLLDDGMRQAMLARFPEDKPLVPGLSDQNLLYVIYTSGSTGQPKGVLVQHNTVMNFLHCSVEHFLPEHIAGALVSAPLAFDGTVCTLYTSLLAGKYVELLPSADTDIDQLADYIFKGEDNLLIKLTPSHLDAMLKLKGLQPHPEIAHLFVVAGEQLTEKTLRPWRDSLLPGCCFINEYGPTEASVGTTIYHSQKDSGRSAVPIGAGLANTELYVLNDALSLQPSGVAGELYIGGAGLARGYLNRPDLSAEKFVAHPFSDEAGARLYRTGDLVRWLPEGQIEFLGRVDHQVKLRGFRIELGEIENQLNRLADIRECVVLCREDSGHDKRLVAYVVPADALEGEDEERLGEEKLARVSAWMEALKGQLPHYMVPGIYVFMDKLPLSPNGKVDRKKLPAPGEGDLQKQQYVAPRNEAEAQLCAIWQEVLGVSEIGIDDNFFALGGDSIISIQVVSRAKRHCLELTVRDIFEHQTIARLSPGLKYSAKREIDQAPTAGAQLLLPIQAFFFEQAFANPQHFNQAVLLHSPAGLDRQALRTVLAALYVRHDVLRLRFSDGKANYLPYSEALLAQSLDEVALAEQEDITAVCDEVQAGLNISEGPVFRARLMTLEDGSARLLLVAHHLVIDGVSWRILLSDLDTAWRAVETGQAPVLASKTDSYQAWAAALHDYAASDALASEKAYWLDQLKASAPGLATHPEGQPASSCKLHLDETTTSLLLSEANQAYRTQVQELLLAALLQAWQDWAGHKHLRVELEGHGRETAILRDALDVSETVGWFTSHYPLMLQAESDDPAAVIKSVKESVRAVPARGIGFGLLRYLKKDGDILQALGAQRPTLKFNYQGQFDSSADAGIRFSLAQESAGLHKAKENAEIATLSLNGFVKNNALEFSISCAANTYSKKQVLSFAEHYKKQLQQCVQHTLFIASLKDKQASKLTQKFNQGSEQDVEELLI